MLALLSLFLVSCPLSAKETTQNGVTNPKVTLVKNIIRDHGFAIAFASITLHVPKEQIVGTIATESANNSYAVSDDNARGLMQTREIADKTVGVECDSFDSWCSIWKGTSYKRYLWQKYGSIERATLAYFEGPKNMRKLTNKKVLSHPYLKTTQGYVRIAAQIFAGE